MKKLLILIILTALFSCEIFNELENYTEMTVINNTQDSITLHLGDFTDLNNKTTTVKSEIILPNSTGIITKIPKEIDLKGWTESVKDNQNIIKKFVNSDGKELYNFKFTSLQNYKLEINNDKFIFYENDIVLNIPTTTTPTTTTPTTTTPTTTTPTTTTPTTTTPTTTTPTTTTPTTTTPTTTTPTTTTPTTTTPTDTISDDWVKNGSGSFKINNYSSKNKIKIHIGNYASNVNYIISPELSYYSTHILESYPVGTPLNLWITDENGNITNLISSITDNIFETTLKDGGNYELKLNSTTFNFYDSGVDLNYIKYFTPYISAPGVSSYTPTKSSPISIIIDFKSEVSALTNEMFSLINCSITSIVTTDNINFSVTVEPTNQGDAEIKLNSKQVTNTLGEYNSEVKLNFVYDSIGPIIEINIIDNATPYTDILHFEMISNEKINGIYTSSFSATNAIVKSYSKDSTYSGAGERYIITVNGKTKGEITLSLLDNIVTDSAGNSSSSVSSGESYSFIPIGVVNEIVPSDNPQFVYALDNTYMQLLKVDVNNEQIDSHITLPHPAPISMKYGKTGNILYIAYKNYDTISRYDLNSETFLSEYTFSATNENYDLDINESLNRIYLLATDPQSSITNQVKVLSLDSGSLIVEGSVEGKMMTVNPNNGDIFTGEKGLSPSSFYHYSATNSNISNIKEIWNNGSNGKYLTISPDGLHVVMFCGGGNGAGYTVHDIDTSDISNTIGEWNVGGYPIYGVFSHDSKYFYAMGDDLGVYDMNYIKLKSYEYDKFDTHILGLNSDSSVLVQYTFDDNYDNNYRFIFFKDIRP